MKASATRLQCYLTVRLFSERMVKLIRKDTARTKFHNDALSLSRHYLHQAPIREHSTQRRLEQQTTPPLSKQTAFPACCACRRRDYAIKRKPKKSSSDRQFGAGARPAARLPTTRLLDPKAEFPSLETPRDGSRPRARQQQRRGTRLINHYEPFRCDRDASNTFFFFLRVVYQRQRASPCLVASRCTRRSVDLTFRRARTVT